MKLIYVIVVLALAGCTNSTVNSSSFVSGSASVQTFSSKIIPGPTPAYEDGVYCATLEYHNPRTGTNRTYALSVEIKNKELVQIRWPNGGWLDDSHFNVKGSDEAGSLAIVSDRANNYMVTIGNNAPCASNSTMPSGEELRVDAFANEDEGYVIWAQPACRYVMIYIGGWYVVANKSYTFLSKGDHVRGNFETFGYQNFYNISNSQEEKIYIDNYYESKQKAMDRIIENCGQAGEEEK